MSRLWNNFYLLIGATMLIWSATAAVATYLFKQGLTAEEVTLVDILFAFVTLLAVTLASPARRRSLAAYRPKVWGQVLLLAVIGILAYNYLMYSALSSDAADVTPYAIINYMWPLTTILFGVIVLREKPTVYTWIGAAVGFLGFALIQFGKSLGAEAVQAAWAAGDAAGTVREMVAATFGDATARGCMVALAGAILWGLFGPLARRWADRYGFGPISSMMVYCAVSAALGLALWAPHVRWAHIFSRWDLVLPLAWVGTMAHGLANVLWLRTIEVGGAGRTGVVAYLTPVMALGYLALFHRQVPSAASAVGLGLILLAVFVAESHRSRRRRVDGRTPRAGDPAA